MLTDERLKQLVKEGKLIPYEEIKKTFTPEENEEIARKVAQRRVARSLRQLRKNLKISQEHLAKKMKVKREYIARIESGNQNVTMETMYKIADATNKTLFFDFR